MMEKSLVEANTRFAFKLFAQLAQQERGKNIFISPTSVFLALAMVYNGAAGETQRGMTDALGLTGLSLDTVNRTGAELLRSLRSIDPQVRLVVANSLWGRQGITFDREFLRRCHEFYAAEIETLDFADPRALAAINGWVRKHTNGKIEKILDQINRDILLVLLNAIYFKGDWQTAFDERLTSDQPFMLTNDGRKMVPMMRRSGTWSFFSDGLLAGISMPYGSGRLQMDLFLPDDQDSLESLLGRLNVTNWSSWLSRFRRADGTLMMPRFKLEYETQLNHVLVALGMERAFDGRRADFSGISQTGPLVIDEVKHKSYVEVNEEGTEAAAVTAVGVRVTGLVMQERRFTMVVDHPFFFTIRDNQSGVILFMGAIVEP
jgi:serpin B